jgi:hypothetical protein
VFGIYRVHSDLIFCSGVDKKFQYTCFVFIYHGPTVTWSAVAVLWGYLYQAGLATNPRPASTHTEAFVLCVWAFLGVRDFFFLPQTLNSHLEPNYTHCTFCNYFIRYYIKPKLMWKQKKGILPGTPFNLISRLIFPVCMAKYWYHPGVSLSLTSRPTWWDRCPCLYVTLAFTRFCLKNKNNVFFLH